MGLPGAFGLLYTLSTFKYRAAVASESADCWTEGSPWPRYYQPPWLCQRREVSLRRYRTNGGFARGVNEACRLSRGNWFLLLNPDMTVREGFLDGVQALANRLERENPRAGIVGFQLRNPDGSRQLS